MAIESILYDADVALADASDSDPERRLKAITWFMCAFEEAAKEIAVTKNDWSVVRSWARGAVDRVLAVRLAVGEWEFEMGELFFSAMRDERDAEVALDRRSQHAFAREVFRDTPVDTLFAQAEDAEVDQDFHDAAVLLALDKPSYAPPSHRWWRQPGE